MRVADIPLRLFGSPCDSRCSRHGFRKSLPTPGFLVVSRASRGFLLVLSLALVVPSVLVETVTVVPFAHETLVAVIFLGVFTEWSASAVAQP